MNPFSQLINSIYRCTGKINKSSFVIHMTGKIRRFWLIHFKKDYVQSQLKLRKGQCRQCARCCTLAFRCPLLTKENLCLTYMKGRPDVCRLFAIDRRDLEDVAVAGGHCGYWFEEGQ